ncbi:uncharacterized protein [Clytia hemisphaerica]|uniref:uncharacterized protein n=1 Tax=Clytia hemisphaerica TaxID=252671 RepID=UPI0034D70B40|eukprot:TCONS_00059847-protein
MNKNKMKLFLLVSLTLFAVHTRTCNGGLAKKLRTLALEYQSGKTLAYEALEKLETDVEIKQKYFPKDFSAWKVTHQHYFWMKFVKKALEIFQSKLAGGFNPSFRNETRGLFYVMLRNQIGNVTKMAEVYRRKRTLSFSKKFEKSMNRNLNDFKISFKKDLLQKYLNVGTSDETRYRILLQELVTFFNVFISHNKKGIKRLKRFG